MNDIIKNISDITGRIESKLETMDGKLDTILSNTSLKTVNSNTIQVLAGLYEDYYTNVNPGATTEQKMAFVTDWLQRYGYLK